MISTCNILTSSQTKEGASVLNETIRVQFKNGQSLFIALAGGGVRKKEDKWDFNRWWKKWYLLKVKKGGMTDKSNSIIRHHSLMTSFQQFKQVLTRQLPFHLLLISKSSSSFARSPRRCRLEHRQQGSCWPANVYSFSYHEQRQRRAELRTRALPVFVRTTWLHAAEPRTRHKRTHHFLHRAARDPS